MVGGFIGVCVCVWLVGVCVCVVGWWCVYVCVCISVCGGVGCCYREVADRSGGSRRTQLAAFVAGACKTARVCAAFRQTTSITPRAPSTKKRERDALTALGLPVELDERLPAARRDELERVHAKALHVAVVERHADVVEQERELVLVC